MKLIRYPNFEIAYAAEGESMCFGSGKAPVNVHEIVKNGFDLKIAYRANPHPIADAFPTFSPRTINVYTNPAHNSDRGDFRERYNIAFGLSYFALNDYYFKNLNLRSEEDFLAAERKNPKDFDSAFSMARVFARHLLIPEFLFYKDLYKGSDMIELARKYEVPFDIMKIRHDDSLMR